MRRGPVQTAEVGCNPATGGSQVVVAAPGLGHRIVVTKCDFSLADTAESRFYVATQSAVTWARFAAFWTGGREMHNAPLLRSDEKPWKCLENESLDAISSLVCTSAQICVHYYIEELL